MIGIKYMLKHDFFWRHVGSLASAKTARLRSYKFFQFQNASHRKQLRHDSLLRLTRHDGHVINA
jgi:hypothetical protein